MGFETAAKSLRQESNLSKEELTVTSDVNLKQLFDDFQKEQADGSKGDTESSDSEEESDDEVVIIQ